MTTGGAIFVLPVTTIGQQGPVAAWVSTAGWASAARRVLGDVWVVTPGGLVETDDVRRRAADTHLAAGSASAWRRRVPTVAKTAVKDVQQWLRARRFRVDPDGPWREREVTFVWQRHELFHTAGVDLARTLGVPSVLFVPATLVWQSRQWSVRRPGWESLAERLGDRPALRRADVVACGSDAVAEQACRCGAPEERVMVTPTGVDVDLFARRPDPGPLRRRLGLAGRFVVGWVGSFRRFHALEQAVDAAARVDDVALLMVGDGPERGRIERLARDRGVIAVFTGTVPHADLPAYLAAMDVAVLMAAGDRPFHYSPLKLAEYLAAGLPVVAPRVPQLADRLTDGVDALLVPPDDGEVLAGALARLRGDPARRARLGTAARVAAEASWSWDHQVRRVLAALG